MSRNGGADYFESATELMNRLSSETLEPHPHFRIVPPARQKEDAPRLWDIEERNKVGYIFEDANRENRKYRTVAKFKARVGLSRYVNCTVLVEKTVGKEGITSQLSVDGLRDKKAEHPHRIAQLSIPLVGGTDSHAISLKIVKDVKQTGGGNLVLVKMANETPMERLKEGSRTYEFGNMIELSVEESADSPISAILETVKGYGLLPSKESPTGKLEFLDYLVSTTAIPRPRPGNTTILELSETYKAKTGSSIEKPICKYVEKKIEGVGGRLYEFQNRGILEIGAQVVGARKPCMVIARTAAGKTEAFLIPVINWIMQQKRVIPGPGVRAIFFYPTKALASDQLQRIVEFLHSINRQTKNPVSVGVYHGDIEERLQLHIPLPLRCVLHEDDIAQGKLRSGEVRLRPDTASKTLSCAKCGEKYPFVLADRFSVTVGLPDILVCTPDVVNYVLMRDKRRHVFLGSKETIAICETCRAVKFEDESACKTCGTSTKRVEVKPEVFPEIVLLDELHLFSSVFGGNVSNLLKRFSAALRTYSGEKSGRLQMIATSATIKNPAEFGKNFFGTDVTVTEAAKEEYDYSDTTSKVAIFASPKAYRMIDSAAYTLFEILRSTRIRTLVFVNSLAACGMLLNNIRQRLSSDPSTMNLIDSVDGHNSTYTRQERAETEEKFNRGEIRALVATSTLEVGVDFKDLDGMILFGAPYNFNNYLQRVGRAGRNNDAVVINFLNPNDPIDLFYYRNAIRLSRDPTEFTEYPPFPADNEAIEQKHVLSSVFDACSIFKMDPVSTLKGFREGPEHIDTETRTYLAKLWPKESVAEASRRLRVATLAIVSEKDLPNATLKRFNLLDLRKSDETVKVEFEEPDSLNPSTRTYRPSVDSSHRKAGFTKQDVELLRELRGY